MRKHVTSMVASGLLGSMLLQSCATIISGTSQTIRLVGQPAGSTVYVNDKEVKTTPVAGTAGAVSIRLPRKRSAEIKVKHEGYKDYSEVLDPNRVNGLMYLNYAWGAAALASIPFSSTESSYTIGGKTYPQKSFTIVPLVTGLGIMLVTPLVDLATGAARKFNKDEVRPLMVRQPARVAGSKMVQCSLVNVRFKGGDKLGNVFVGNETKDILYFGKSLDVDADNLKNNVNSALKDLGYTVPQAEGQGVFSPGSTARYVVQAEMHDIKYDIHVSSPFAQLARYETNCTLEVTWKLLGPGRQTVLERKTAGTSVKFENGGSAAFTDAFENSLYAFLEQASPLLSKTATAGSPATAAGAAPAETDKPATISMHRAGHLKLTGDNGIGAAAKCVVTLSTPDGHGSGCIISADGYLVTNAHVVGEEDTVHVQLADGVEVKGHVVRVNRDMDLALVKIDSDGLSAFPLPTASKTEVGADVFAIGTPADKELGQSITKGIISGRRKIDGHTLLQTDVSINAGNSGGALVARSGQLLGIVNAKLVGRGIEGIGFAIPAEEVSDALQLKFFD